MKSNYLLRKNGDHQVRIMCILVCIRISFLTVFRFSNVRALQNMCIKSVRVINGVQIN